MFFVIEDNEIKFRNDSYLLNTSEFRTYLPTSALQLRIIITNNILFPQHYVLNMDTESNYHYQLIIIIII